jgi:hypothetical protein
LRKFYFLVALIGFALVLTYVGFCAEEINIKASVDKNKLSRDQTLALRIEISGILKGSPEIKLPDFKKDFEVISSGQSQSISIKDKEKSQIIAFEYLLTPKRSGKITIGEVVMAYEGKAYKTAPIEIEVSPSAIEPKPSVPPQEEIPPIEEDKGTII